MYNIVVQECNHNTCYSCGCTRHCNALKKAGLKTPFLKSWKELSDSEKLIISNIAQEEE